LEKRFGAAAVFGRQYDLHSDPGRQTSISCLITDCR